MRHHTKPVSVQLSQEKCEDSKM